MPIEMPARYEYHYYIAVMTSTSHPHTQPTPTSRFVLGYLGAVSSAISIAVSVILHYAAYR